MPVSDRSIRVLILGVTLALAPAGARAGSVAGCQLFPADSIWNARIDSLPLDPNSSTYIDTIGADTGLHPDFGSGEWPPGSGAPIGIPYDVVDSSQPEVPIDFLYDDESDPGPYPIPPDASIEGGPNATGDRHVLVVDNTHCVLYELFYAFPVNGGSSWTASSGAVFPLDSYALRPDGWTSADAAGLPILPGLVSYDEVDAGRIDHAIRFTVPETRRAYVWPARHFASSLTGDEYPPMGQRFRLRSDFDISGFSPSIQVILTAFKEYGIILADNGSAWYISGIPDPRWDNDELRELRDVEGSDFEAVDVSSLMVHPDSAQVAFECDAEPDVTVEDRIIETEETFEACGTITVGADVEVLGPDGRALFHAGGAVSFLDGLLVGWGGEIAVHTGLPLATE